MEHLESLPPRRTFLKWLTHGIGAVFAVVLGAPVVAYLMDPLNRPKSESGFRTVDGVRLGLMESGVWKPEEWRVGEPKAGIIRNVRRDAWTLYPDDVVGRVFVVKNVDLDLSSVNELLGLGREMEELEKKIDEAEKLPDPEKRKAELKKLEADQARIDAKFQAKISVFTTVCPHLGCSINLTPPAEFTCPCHGAKFDVKGGLLDRHDNPAPRGMDSLKWVLDAQDPGLLRVKYVNYYQGRAEKVPKS